MIATEQKYNILQSHPVASSPLRQFRKLRVSLTPVCNFGCPYCDPSDLREQPSEKRTPVRSAEEWTRAISRIHEVTPLTSVRLTGGEPLLYSGLGELVFRLRDLNIPSINITTNGSLLAKKAEDLAKAGLHGVNLSLDTLDPDRFRKVSGHLSIEETIAGLDLAVSAGLHVKLNATIMKGFNEDQVLPLLNFAFEKGVEIRFIELMSMGHLYGSENSGLYPKSAILADVAEEYTITPLVRERSGTAIPYLAENGRFRGNFGIIANESTPFCDDCDRLRLTHDMQLVGCISSRETFPMNPESGVSLKRVLNQAMASKRQDRFTGSPSTMLGLGG